MTQSWDRAQGKQIPKSRLWKELGMSHYKQTDVFGTDASRPVEPVSNWFFKALLRSEGPTAGDAVCCAVLLNSGQNYQKVDKSYFFFLSFFCRENTTWNQRPAASTSCGHHSWEEADICDSQQLIVISFPWPHMCKYLKGVLFLDPVPSTSCLWLLFACARLPIIVIQRRNKQGLKSSPWKCGGGRSEQRWMERIQRKKNKKIKGSPAQVPHNALYSSRLPQSTLRFKRLVQWHFLILSHTASKEKNRKKERKKVSGPNRVTVESCVPACRGSETNRVNPSQPGITVFVMMLADLDSTGLVAATWLLAVGSSIHLRKSSPQNTSVQGFRIWF